MYSKICTDIMLSVYIKKRMRPGYKLSCISLLMFFEEVFKPLKEKKDLPKMQEFTKETT